VNFITPGGNWDSHLDLRYHAEASVKDNCLMMNDQCNGLIFLVFLFFNTFSTLFQGIAFRKKVILKISSADFPA